MDARLVPGEEYSIVPKGDVRAKYLGQIGERAYFSARGGRLFLAALDSALERIGDSVKLKNPQEKITILAGDLAMFSERDRRNILKLINGLEARATVQ